MTLYLLRHAAAGDRSSWDGDDRLRPLSKKGRRQALRLAELLGGTRLDRIVSSPYVRCTETVAPLAERRGLTVEEHGALAEGSRLPAVLALVDDLVDGGSTVVCSHGDVIPMLLGQYADRGVDLGPEPACAKASIWIIETDAVGTMTARYARLPPERHEDRADRTPLLHDDGIARAAEG